MKFNRFLKKLSSKGAPLVSVLVDPDKFNPGLVANASRHGVDCFLVGGSFLEKGNAASTVRQIKKLSRLPVFLFPGDETQLTGYADGLLLLSLLSGRNPDYLIEKHINAAPMIKKLGLAHIPVAYLLIDGKTRTSTETVTRTRPLDPLDKRKILNTSLAAEQLGFKAIYLEAGSGASRPVNPSIIQLIKKNVSLPLIVGGGISTPDMLRRVLKAEASMVVIGNALERDATLLPLLGNVIKEFRKGGRRL